MKTLLRAVLQCVLILSLTHVLYARTGEYVILTKSNFQYTTTTWSYTLTGVAYTSGGTPITPQGTWTWYWEDNTGLFDITYGSNNSTTLQRDIGVEHSNVWVYLVTSSWNDLSNSLGTVGDLSTSYSEVNYYESGVEWQITVQTNVFIDGNSVSADQTYTWWVKRYFDGVADPGYWQNYIGTVTSNQMTIDGNYNKPNTPCWTWQFYAVVEFENDHTIQSGTIWLPMYFGHYPCFPEARIVTDPLSQDGKAASEVPNVFLLEQNYPNPFNPETEITFALPEPSIVRLSVLDVLGREIAVLEDRHIPAGYRSVRWNGRNSSNAPVSSGMYFYRLTATGESGKNFVETKKMLMTK